MMHIGSKLWLGVALALGGCGCSSDTGDAETRNARMPIEAGQGVVPPGVASIGPDFEQNPRGYGPSALGEVDVRGVAFDGQNYLVAWQYWGNRQWCQAARVTPDGRLLDTVAIDIDDPSRRETVVAAASDGSGFVVGYRSEDPAHPGAQQYRIKRIASDGTILDPVGIALTDANRATQDLRLVSNGEAYLAIWTEQAEFSYTDPYFLRAAWIDDEAVAPVTKYVEVAQTLASTAASDVKLAAAATRGGYLIAYTMRHGDDADSGFDLALVRLDEQGNVTVPPADGTATLLLGATSNSPLALASDGEDAYLTWTDFAQDSRGQWRESVYGVGVTRDATFVEPTPTRITTSDHDHELPGIVFDGARYLISYLAEDPSVSGWEPHLRGNYVSREGVLATEAEFELVQGTSIAPVVAPSCQGNCFFAWAAQNGRQRSIYSAIYDHESGAVAEQRATLVSVQPEAESLRELVCNSRGCVALYTLKSYDSRGEHLYLKAAGLGLDGRLHADSTFTLTELTDESYFPTALAGDEAGYLALWWDATNRALKAIPLDAMGAPHPGSERIVSGISSIAYELRMVPSGQGYLLLRTEPRTNREVLVGSLLDRGGQLIEPNRFELDPGSYGESYVTHLVAASGGFFVGYVRNSAPAVARLDASGRIVNSAGFDLTASAGAAVSVFDMASNGAQLLVVWCDPETRPSPADSCIPRGTLVEPDGTRSTLSQPLGPACSHGWLVFNGNEFVWAWTTQMSWGFAPYEQHFTETVLGEGAKLQQRDLVTTRDQSAYGFGRVTMNRGGLLWSYHTATGTPAEGFVGPERIHRRQIVGLCLGDPRGDANCNGICDSNEPEWLTPLGSAGAGNTQGTGGALGAGTHPNGVAGRETLVASGGVNSSEFASHAGGNSGKGDTVGGAPSPNANGTASGTVTSNGGAGSTGPRSASQGTAQLGGSSGSSLTEDARWSSGTGTAGASASAFASSPRRVKRGEGLQLSGSGCSCRTSSTPSNPLRVAFLGTLLYGLQRRRRQGRPLQ